MRDLQIRLFAAVFMTGLSLIAAGPAIGQGAAAECDTGYQKFLANRKGPEFEKFKIALTAGRDYLAKCGNLEGQDEIRTYVTKQLPRVEETVRITEIVNRFNASIPARNWDESFASGKELIAANHPLTLDVMIVLAAIGYASAASDPPVDKYNDDAVTYAKQVIQKLGSGASSETYGAYSLSYKTKTCTDGKTNTISWMNYTIGKIMYSRLRQTKDSLAYLLKANQTGCELKDYPEVYRLVGAWYVDEAVRLNTVREAKLKAANDEETAETRADLALIKGYADRAISAYGRAYKIASTRSDMPAAYKEALYKKLQDLFDTRYDGKHDGVDTFLEKVMSEPFLDPAIPVTPVVDVPPAPPAAAPPSKAPPKTTHSNKA